MKWNRVCIFSRSRLILKFARPVHIGLHVENQSTLFSLPPMSSPEGWAVDSNEAVELTMLGPSASRSLKFHPTFTYPIFGEAETIYGYKGLSIDLSLAGWDLRAYLKVTWKEKIDSDIESEVENIEETLREYLPEGVPDSFL